MNKVHTGWTVVYKEKDGEVRAFTYTSLDEAKKAKQMVDDSNGGDLIDDEGKYVGTLELEWCYLVNGKIIESIDTHSDNNKQFLQ